MDEPYISQPDVMRMIRLAAKRAKNMFAAYSDMDEESLVADGFGAVGLATYKPEKMKPHSFAYMCAWARFLDISRKRSKELQHLQKANDENGVRLSHVYASEITEDTDAALGEKLRMFYVSCKNQLESLNIPVRPPRCALPDADRAQRAALLLLKDQQGWTYRQAEIILRERPNIARAIGVTYSPSRTFFSRAKDFCHIVKNNSSAHPTAA
jgi:DNA-directed RNA polymerase specialized sigma24 family protein